MILQSIEALNAAELKFQDIINSPTVDAACKKIDHLAEKNQLDSALVMMITKAWSAAKELSMTKDEVKDVLYHLYVTARGNLQRFMPKEIRMLKCLLTIEDPEELLAALHDLFTPGEELEGTDVDNLFTYASRTQLLLLLSSWYSKKFNGYPRNPVAAAHLDEGYCGCLTFQPGRHSNKGSKRPHESKDH